MTISFCQLRELARLVDGMVWDYLDNQLLRLERHCRNYLKTPKAKGEK